VEGVGQVDAGGHDAGIQADRLAELGFGLAVPGLVSRKQAQAVPGLCEAGVERGGRAQVLVRLVELFDGAQRLAEVSLQPGRSWVQGDRSTEEIDGQGGTALLEEKHAETFEGRRRARVERQHLAVALLGLGELAADMAGVCLVKCVFDAH
jgi:hypothetical protein